MLSERRETLPKRDKEEGITGLEVICLLIFLAVAIYVVFTHVYTPNEDGGTPRGLIAGAVYESGDSVRMYGMPVGYSSVSREIEGIDAVAATENPSALGFLLVSVTPLIGDLAIDLDRMEMTIVSSGTKTLIIRSRGASVGPGNWTIAGKSNMIPMKSADEDDLLEASEIFDLLISMPEPFFPYQKFSVVLSPEHGVPYTQKLTVPPLFTPVVKFA